MRYVRRRLAKGLFGLVVTTLALNQAWAEKFPDKPVKIVNTFAAGGPTDIAVRVLAQKMSDTLGQQVIVEAKPGGSSSIAANYVANQVADGYTLLLSNNQVTSNPLLYKKLSYKLTDFAPVGMVFKSTNAFVISNAVPANTLKEFVEYAKQRPGEINYAILGFGGSPHVSGKMLEKASGIRMTEVSYKGAAESSQDLFAGRIQAMFVNTAAALSYQKGGQAKLLGVTSPSRLEQAPDVPTFREQGFDIIAQPWFGLVAPAATPKDRISIINGALQKAVASQEFQSVMKTGANSPSASSPQELADFMRADYAAWEAILKPLNLQLD